jgi:lipoic acid synthetase
MKRRLPPWFKRPVANTPSCKRTEDVLRRLRLNTVCDSAHCPNRAECYNEATATVMILGDRCTRNCSFCAVSSALPEPPDPEEPERVARAAKELGLKYAVITSVTRDDLPDGGAGQFASAIEALRRLSADTIIEILTPDFCGNEAALKQIAEARPDVWAHNVEVVPRLYPDLRPRADYRQSVELLASIKACNRGIVTKSAFMVGVGEMPEETLDVACDLRRAKVDLLVVGQYLAPSREHWPVAKFYTPEEFADLERRYESLGFFAVQARPLARSSYRAEEMYRNALNRISNAKMYTSK